MTRSALQNAASIAGLLLTTEALVADKPEKVDAAARPPPWGGMGGMGGRAAVLALPMALSSVRGVAVSERPPLPAPDRPAIVGTRNLRVPTSAKEARST